MLYLNLCIWFITIFLVYVEKYRVRQLTLLVFNKLFGYTYLIQLIPKFILYNICVLIYIKSLRFFHVLAQSFKVKMPALYDNDIWHNGSLTSWAAVYSKHIYSHGRPPILEKKRSCNWVDLNATIYIFKTIFHMIIFNCKYRELSTNSRASNTECPG